MNKERAFILGILKAIESLQDGVVAYAYKDGNSTGSVQWWSICISNYDMYFGSGKFRSLTKVWHKRAIELGTVVLFSYCMPLESKLVQLLKQDNLIMNV